jgi:hypothetical protein
VQRSAGRPARNLLQPRVPDPRHARCTGLRRRQRRTQERRPMTAPNESRSRLFQTSRRRSHGLLAGILLWSATSARPWSSSAITRWRHPRSSRSRKSARLRRGSAGCHDGPGRLDVPGLRVFCAVSRPRTCSPTLVRVASDATSGPALSLPEQSPAGPPRPSARNCASRALASPLQHPCASRETDEDAMKPRTPAPIPSCSAPPAAGAPSPSWSAACCSSLDTSAPAPC